MHWMRTKWTVGDESREAHARAQCGHCNLTIDAPCMHNGHPLVNKSMLSFATLLPAEHKGLYPIDSLMEPFEL